MIVNLLLQVGAAAVVGCLTGAFTGYWTLRIGLAVAQTKVGQLEDRVKVLEDRTDRHTRAIGRLEGEASKS